MYCTKHVWISFAIDKMDKIYESPPSKMKVNSMFSPTFPLLRRCPLSPCVESMACAIGQPWENYRVVYSSAEHLQKTFFCLFLNLLLSYYYHLIAND